jgi:hypothetical protein
MALFKFPSHSTSSLINSFDNATISEPEKKGVEHILKSF